MVDKLKTILIIEDDLTINFKNMNVENKDGRLNLNFFTKILFSSALIIFNLSFCIAEINNVSKPNLILFGQIAVGLTKASNTQTQVATTGFGSGIGFMGTDDLASNLQLYFDLEHRFDLSTGTLGEVFFDEKSAVGFKTLFGNIQFGRFKNAHEDILFKGDPFGGDTVANIGNKNALAERKWNKSIGLFSQIINGFSATFTTASKVNDARTPYAFNIQYEKEAVTTGLAFARNSSNAADTFTFIGNYNFGPATLYTTTSKSVHMGSANARSAQLGMAVPVSNKGTLKAVFGTYEIDSKLVDRSNKVGVGYWHNLSTRTLAYFDLGLTKIQKQIDLGIFIKF